MAGTASDDVRIALFDPTTCGVGSAFLMRGRIVETGATHRSRSHGTSSNKCSGRDLAVRLGRICRTAGGDQNDEVDREPKLVG